jgi:hypothetical protein
MERICKNCEHFVQVSSASEHIWGDCMKSVSAVGADGRKEHVMILSQRNISVKRIDHP